MALPSDVSSPKDLRKLDEQALPKLADELRAEVIRTVSETGGHLGSSLGVVELTVALHKVFDTPRDKLIWDVGHQCYPHKILTGRMTRMGTLRQEGGLSGFTKRSESKYDPFGAAHSSTSISAGLGFAVGRDLGQDVGDVVAVIGDGSISAGMAYEALNNLGALGKRMFVVLNDNEMSIAPPVGAMSTYLSRLKNGEDIVDMTEVLPERQQERARKIRALVTGQTDPGTMFENLGFEYIGPVDGHDLSVLVPLLKALKVRSSGPVLIHVATVKGKGYAPAESAADCGHGVSKFDVKTGAQFKSKPNAPSYTTVFGQQLTQLAKQDPRIVAVTAAMPSGTGVDILEDALPDRVFDVGIAEQHAVTFSAGMAAAGLRPFCAIYSTFLQRGYDQIVHDVALQKLPVRFAVDRAGLVGADGATHAGSFDIGFLSALPNMVVMAASNEAELARMVATAAEHDEGPIALRYPRGAGVGVPIPVIPKMLEIGKGHIVSEGSDIAFLSLGAHLPVCQDAAELLAAFGVTVTIADARFAKPYDIALVRQLLRHHQVLITVEQGARGGFGAMLLQDLANCGAMDRGCAIRTITLPDRFIDQASPDAMYSEAGMASADLAATALQAIGQQISRDGIMASR